MLSSVAAGVVAIGILLGAWWLGRRMVLPR
jgi:hypothetical protein